MEVGQRNRNGAWVLVSTRQDEWSRDVSGLVARSTPARSDRRKRASVADRVSGFLLACANRTSLRNSRNESVLGSALESSIWSGEFASARGILSARA